MASKSQRMPKGYALMWLFFTAAYLVWMLGFMRPDTYPPAETGWLSPWMFYAWIPVSALFMLLFIVYIARFLYGTVTKGVKMFALISLLFGCAFITGYCFFKNPLDYTASMIGLDYPWHFKMWGLFASMSIFANTMYAFRKYNYNSRVGIIAGSIGCAALFVTINVPSAGEDLILNSLRCMSHWSGALIFAFGAATPVVLFLFHLAKSKKAGLVLALAFCAALAVSLTLLVVIGKDGIIEGVPTWAVYIVLFLVNFTPLFESKNDPAVLKKSKTAVHV